MTPFTHLVGLLLSGFISWMLAVQKSNRNGEKRLALANARLKALEDRMQDHRRDTSKAIEAIISDIRAATAELHTASQNINLLNQTQAIINNINTKALDTLSKRADDNGECISEIREELATLKALYDKIK